MQAAAEHPADDWIARGISLALHALLLAFVTIPMFRPEAKHTVLLTVETVSGVTPLGEGTGVEGNRANVSDIPANANPLLNGVKLKMDEIAAPILKDEPPKGRPKPVVARPETVQELQKKYESMPLGIKPRDGVESEDLSEGGMGNARKAGSPDGLVGISGPIAGRHFVEPDLSYPGTMPEESSAEVMVVVTPQGEVVSANLEKSSGYAELDQWALTKSREFRFDFLAPAAVQENENGKITFKFDYGKVTVH